MTELGIGEAEQEQAPQHKHGRGCAAGLVALAIILALGVFTYVKGVGLIKDMLSGPADYNGNGHGSVLIEVDKGDTSAQIGATLKREGVVKSVAAFTDAATADERSLTIQDGFYELRLQMSGQSALELLLDPDSRVQNQVTIPEGLRANEILQMIAAKTDFTQHEVQAAYDDTASLGLPTYAKGDAEGYLFPSTYNVTPGMTATELLQLMVQTFKLEADKAGLAARADELGYSPHDIVTIASLVQAESGAADMSKVASVVYNRLDEPMPLEFDSTLHYAVDSRGEVVAGSELRHLDSPYNTYTRPGLPPTPINSPGAEALEAALHPADTDFLYFVTVNLKTGETRFASDYADHLRNVQAYREYCATSDEC